MLARALRSAPNTGWLIGWLVGAALVAPRGVIAQGAHHSSRPQPAAASAAVPVVTPVIVLERTDCHGQCGEYRLSFYDDGLVIYDGRANVSKAGRWRASVPRQTVGYLVGEFQRIGFAALDDKYPPGLTQTSTAITTLRVGSKTKSVTHDVGSPFPPAALATLEDRIDASVQSANWTR